VLSVFWNSTFVEIVDGKVVDYIRYLWYPGQISEKSDTLQTIDYGRIHGDSPDNTSAE
jgi:hypothetical protein